MRRPPRSAWAPWPTTSGISKRESGRWWVVTNPTNFYAQEDFKSRDVVLTFHVGLVLRMTSRETVPISAGSRGLPSRRPRAADVKAWINLFANDVAGGPSAAKLRSNLKTMSEQTWSHVNWLTHAKNATHFDAVIATAVTSHLLATVTAAAMRARTERGNRCGSCDSYAMVAGRCDVCGSIDADHEPPSLPPEPDEGS